MFNPYKRVTLTKDEAKEFLVSGRLPDPVTALAKDLKRGRFSFADLVDDLKQSCAIYAPYDFLSYCIELGRNRRGEVTFWIFPVEPAGSKEARPDAA